MQIWTGKQEETYSEDNIKIETDDYDQIAEEFLEEDDTEAWIHFLSHGQKSKSIIKSYNLQGVYRIR